MLEPSRDRHADHAVLLYEHPAGFVAPVVKFMREGASAGEHLIVAVSAEKSGWLRDELDGEGLEIQYAGAEQFYARLGSMFASIQDLIRRHATSGQRGLRIVAEHPLAGRSAAHRRAYMRYEAASNVVYGGHDVAVLCAYDADAVPDTVLEHALSTHPLLVRDDERLPSERFVDPRAFIVETSRRARTPAELSRVTFERPQDVSALRAAVEQRARAAGLTRQRCDDLVLAATEVATNALNHGPAPRFLACFVDDGDLVCEITDAGPGPEDPLAGYLSPSTDRSNGFGLWIAHQACDVVEVSGGTVSLRMRLPVAG